MAGRAQDNDVGLAPADAPAQAEYERDFYSWLMEQARFVRDYRKARIEAAREMELDEDQFPQQCPYSWDDIVLREFSL